MGANRIAIRCDCHLSVIDHCTYSLRFRIEFCLSEMVADVLKTCMWKGTNLVCFIYIFAKNIISRKATFILSNSIFSVFLTQQILNPGWQSLTSTLVIYESRNYTLSKPLIKSGL